MLGMMKRYVLTIAAMLPAVVIAMPAVRAADPSAPAKEDGRERHRDPALDRVVAKICRKGGCQGKGMLSLVQVWRNKQGRARLLVYKSAVGVCSNQTISYHDPTGRVLVYQQTGLREPDEWNSPDDRKIRKLRAGLTLAEDYACQEIMSTDVRPIEPRK